MKTKQTETNWSKVRELVAATDKEILKAVVKGIDGHVIYDAKKFTEAGLSEEIVAAFSKEHVSDASDPKAQIIVNGKPVQTIRGVYGLQLLEFIADTFDVTSWKEGRGSRARHLAEKLSEKFA